MMKLIWLPEAKADLERLYAVLADKNLISANHALQRILDATINLEDFPEIGRPMGDGTFRREFFIPFGVSKYVLRYRLTDTHIVIIRVWHSREAR